MNVTILSLFLLIFVITKIVMVRCINMVYRCDREKTITEIESNDCQAADSVRAGGRQGLLSLFAARRPAPGTEELTRRFPDESLAHSRYFGMLGMAQWGSLVNRSASTTSKRIGSLAPTASQEEEARRLQSPQRHPSGSVNAVPVYVYVLRRTEKTPVAHLTIINRRFPWLRHIDYATAGWTSAAQGANSGVRGDRRQS